MTALNHQLNEIMINADGRYLNNEELRPLESYVETYQKRLQAYQVLGQHTDAIVLEALKRFARLHPEIIKQSGKRCQYDMTNVLRYIALGILIDDEFMFRETMMFWLDTMLRAHHKQEACCKAYQFLDEVIQESYPGNVYEQVHPYIQIIFESMQPYT